MYFSIDKNGFCDPTIHGPPADDDIALSDEAYRQLLDEQSSGRAIEVVGGEVVSAERSASQADARLTIDSRLAAIDAVSARALRAIAVAQMDGGDADPQDAQRLSDLEAEALRLRDQRRLLSD